MYYINKRMPNAWYIQCLIYSALSAPCSSLHSRSYCWAQYHNCKVHLASCHIPSSDCVWIHNWYWSHRSRRTHFNSVCAHPIPTKHSSSFWPGGGGQVSLPIVCRHHNPARHVNTQPTWGTIHNWHCRCEIYVQIKVLGYSTYICIILIMY